MSMLDEALKFARAEIPVFPCVPKGKRPLTKHGFEDATIDVAQLRSWWSKWPDANIAMPTGTPRWDVLDVDVKPDGSGYDALRSLRDAGLIGGRDDWCHSVQTPSGGLHLYFPGTSHGNSSLPKHHIDYRGAGGYVLVPPSVVATSQGDRSYVTMRINPTANAGAAIDWEAIRNHLDPAPKVDVPATRPLGAHAPADVRMPYLVTHVARAPEGNRNSALYWAANRALDNGATDLEPLVAAAVDAGLPPREAVRTVRSARHRRGPAAKLSQERATPASPAGLAR